MSYESIPSVEAKANKWNLECSVPWNCPSLCDRYMECYASIFIEITLKGIFFCKKLIANIGPSKISECAANSRGTQDKEK